MISRFVKSKFLLNIACFASLLTLVSCAKKSKSDEVTTFEGLKAKADAYIEKNKKAEAIEALEKMVEQYADKPDLTNYRLKLANLYFDKGEYESSYTCYKRFYKMNPSDPLAEFAKYRGILCKFHQTFGPKHDMTNVSKTVKRCETYLASNDKAIKYKKEVKDILYTCEKMLIDHEIFVHNFYLRRGMYKSAQSRIDYLKDNFSKKHKELEPQLLYLEIKLAHNQKNENLKNQKLQALEHKFKDSQYVAMAHNVGNKIRDTFLF